jgi:hypothetical protein
MNDRELSPEAKATIDNVNAFLRGHPNRDDLLEITLELNDAQKKEVETLCR